MLIIGCDFHPRFQQAAIFDNQTGEYGENRLERLSCMDAATLSRSALSKDNNISRERNKTSLPATVD